MSWYLPSSPNNKINFNYAHVFDSYSNFHYYCFQEDSTIYILEYELAEKDTIYKQLQKIDYIIGSGQHTYSFIVNTNGYLTEAPISYYTQSKKWDMSPGYEKGHNTRFDRKIEAECITCHNGYAQQVSGSINKYHNIPMGIDCERCHGPGSLHIDKIKAGEYEFKNNAIDYSIVNPKYLSIQQQNNLCQRCHLNGLSVLNDSCTYYQHQPSDLISQTFNVFVPNIEGSNNEMIMVSHVQRMYESQCYIKSQKMSCITCHNPHISYLQTPKDTFNKPCKQCHAAPKTACTQDIVVRNKNNDDCSGCHMKKNGSVDIPHVSITDHKIVKYITTENSNKELNFKGLKCYTTNSPNNKSKAKAFLDYFEKIKNNPVLLDSASKYLAPSPKDIKGIVRFNYLAQNNAANTELAANHPPTTITEAWTAYRLGESFKSIGNYENTIAYFEQAVKLMPYCLDFQIKLGEAYLKQNEINKAQKTFEFIIQENSKYYIAYNNLGLIHMNKGEYSVAQQMIEKSLALNPNNVQALINLAVAFYNQKNITPIKSILQKAVKIEPSNAQVLAMLKSLN